MADGKQENRMADDASWGRRSSAGASGPRKPSGRKATAASQGAQQPLRFVWRPEASDFPVSIEREPQPTPVLRTGENPYQALPPFEFNYPTHETSQRTPAKFLPPVFAVLVIVGAFFARDRWMPGGDGATATPTVTATATQVLPTATSSESLLTQVSGTAPAATPIAGTTTASATAAAIATATTPVDDGAAGFEVGLVEAAEGDTLIDIADAIGLEVSTLVWANDIEDPGAPLEAGTLVVVPPTDGVLHTVAEGESLASIATLYGVDPSVITGVTENGISSDLDIEPGITLLIPGAVPPSRPDVAMYTVREGDDLWGIADYYGLSPFTLAYANEIVEPFVIQVDQQLVVPPADGIYLLVQVDQTVESIAAEYGVEVSLIRDFPFNQMQDPFAQPKVGQPLMIPSMDALITTWNGGSGGEPTPEPVGMGGPGDGVTTSEAQSGAGHVTGSFVWPAVGDISQGFGNGHSGLDIAATFGTPIIAADGGTVAFAGWNDAGLGYAVKIDHGGGLQTWYGHFDSEPFVSAGQMIAQGDQLGLMGSTGKSTGPHLHFMVVLNDIAQDPLGRLP